jgi:hypothetical protein
VKRGGDLLTLPLRDLTLELTHFPVGAELARDDFLTDDRSFVSVPRPTVGAGLPAMAA